MKILFVRPPRYMWPFHSENSSFWQPIGFASMAAVLRENIDDITLKIIDFPVIRVGWKKVASYLQREKPDILCIGEETVSVHEAFRLVKLAKQMFPDIKIIAGGMYFTYMVNDSLRDHPIDFIVRFEGEETLLELIKELKKEKRKQNFSRIKGISFMEKGKVVETELRPLIDMEKLPIPAYDLLPMHLYGKGSKNHRDFVAIEHSRGCTCSCNFCVLWKQMGQIDVKTGKVIPCYRTKSVKKTVEEVVYVADKFKRKTFCWVDPTWNVNSRWNKEFAEELIKSGVDVDHSVWLRADYVVRDEQKGIFAKQVKAGVKQAMIGIERTDNDDLKYLDKVGYSFNVIKKAFEIVRKYPQVYSLATYLYGVPNETRQSLKRFYDLLGKIPFDTGVPLPLTPNPGTRYFDELEKKNLIEIKDFKYYNFINPVARSKYLS
ncbi:B12-binding domain-containing radical SAM protein, partial [candidate division KSB1 bacterium]